MKIIHAKTEVDFREEQKRRSGKAGDVEYANKARTTMVIVDSLISSYQTH